MDSVDAVLVWIEKGVPDGHMITFKDMADEYINVRAGSINVLV